MNAMGFEGAMAEGARDGRQPLSPHTLRRVEEFILANLGRKLTLAELAEVAGYSAFHFARAFRYCKGESPYAFVRRRRIRRCCELLAHSEMPIGEIVALSGFGTHSSFSSAFKKETGVTPTLYRQRATSGAA